LRKGAINLDKPGLLPRDRACRDPFLYKPNTGSCSSAKAAAARGEHRGELAEPQAEGLLLPLNFAFRYDEPAEPQAC